jgi:hypothetical protein
VPLHRLHEVAVGVLALPIDQDARIQEAVCLTSSVEQGGGRRQAFQGVRAGALEPAHGALHHGLRRLDGAGDARHDPGRLHVDEAGVESLRHLRRPRGERGVRSTP